ncbi:hypothetical protein V6N12_021429 [Hibiscus sabdariffa]|uniref:Uncharacterized protein n=1 Tax=Hibiscus sabdariffa TaxID=183260 RepID=A0ABR2FRL6_9ROSI
MIFFFIFGDRFSAQLLLCKGLELSSATLASANVNLIPAFTFILAVFFRFLMVFMNPIFCFMFYDLYVFEKSTLSPSVFPVSAHARVEKVAFRSSSTLAKTIGTIASIFGPVFVASFKPTQIVIAIATGALFFGEAVFLGSVIGSYFYLWVYIAYYGEKQKRNKK